MNIPADWVRRDRAPDSNPRRHPRRRCRREAELLTHSRAKPAVSFAGTHRLIDFSLSNCHNSEIDDVWVSQQFNAASLSDHVSNGRPWDLDRTSGGLLVLHPREGNEGRSGFQQGTADALSGATPT